MLHCRCVDLCCLLILRVALGSSHRVLPAGHCQFPYLRYALQVCGLVPSVSHLCQLCLLVAVAEDCDALHWHALAIMLMPTDTGNNAIRALTIGTNNLSTIVSTVDVLSSPQGVAWDASGAGSLIIADSGNHVS